MSGAAMRGNRHREEPEGVEGRPSFDGLCDAAIQGGSFCPSFPGPLRFARDDGLGSAERDKQR
jgi:hypothetical protein